MKDFASLSASLMTVEKALMTNGTSRLPLMQERAALMEEIAALADEGGDADAMNFYGRARIAGDHGAEIDIDRGVALLQKAADMGHVQAMVGIADFYTGQVVDLNVECAGRWRFYEKAAAAGDEYAHYRLAEMHLIGEYAKKNDAVVKKHSEYLLECHSPYGYCIEGRRLAEIRQQWDGQEHYIHARDAIALLRRGLASLKRRDDMPPWLKKQMENTRAILAKQGYS